MRTTNGAKSRVNVAEEQSHREFPPLSAYDEESAKNGTAERGSKDPEPPSIVLRRAHEIVAELREPVWLIYKVLEAFVLAVIAGARGTFKSFIALDWMMRVALEGKMVVILSAEGNDIDRRIDAWMRAHAPGRELSTLLVVVHETALNLSIPAEVEALQNAITAAAQQPDFVANMVTTPAVIMIDTLSKFAPGIKENDNGEVGAYLSTLSLKLRDAYRATVLLVAHTGHGDATRPRGAYSLMANPDCEYMVNRPSAVAMTVTVTRERFKSTPSLPPLAYEAKVVDLGRLDAYGDRVTSLVVFDTEAPAPAARVGKNQQKALIALTEWARNNPAAEHISSISITEIFKAQSIDSKRRKEVITYLTTIRILTPSIGGFTFDRAML